MDNSQYLDVFIEESRENLQSLNSMLLSLEEKGFDEESMNEAFRAMHTIKGTAGVIGIPPIQELAHVLEDLFDVLRKKKEIPSRSVIELLFSGVDTIGKMLDELEVSGSTHASITDLAGRIKAVIEAPAPSVPPQAPAPAATADEPKPAPAKPEPTKKARPEGARPVIMSITWTNGLKFKEGRAYQVSKAIAPLASLLASSPDMAEVSDSDEGLILVLGTTESDESLLGRSAPSRGWPRSLWSPSISPERPAHPRWMRSRWSLPRWYRRHRCPRRPGKDRWTLPTSIRTAAGRTVRRNIRP